MGAALQPSNPDFIETDTFEANSIEIRALDERQLTAVSQIEQLADYNLPRALNQILRLESEVTQLVTEVRALREALARAEHRIANQEQLLANAKIREFELRAKMMHESP